MYGERFFEGVVVKLMAAGSDSSVGSVLQRYMLLWNPAQAKAKLGWEATTTAEILIAMMVDADMGRVAWE